MTEQFPMNFLSSYNDLLIRTGQCLWCNVAGLAQLLISLNGVSGFLDGSFLNNISQPCMVIGIIWKLEEKI